MTMYTKIVAVSFLVVCLAAMVTSDCYKMTGCVDHITEKEYDTGYKWKSIYDPCYTCKCYESKKFVLGCQEVVDDSTIKKSGLKITASFGEISFVAAEQIQVSEYEAYNITCNPIPLPALDAVTGKLELVTYRSIYYYTTEKTTHCCRRFGTYNDVHPSCRVVSVGQCKTKVVKEDNHEEICDMPYSVFE